MRCSTICAIVSQPFDVLTIFASIARTFCSASFRCLMITATPPLDRFDLFVLLRELLLILAMKTRKDLVVVALLLADRVGVQLRLVGIQRDDRLQSLDLGAELLVRRDSTADGRERPPS
jgi:hypothetical protein